MWVWVEGGKLDLHRIYLSIAQHGDLFSELIRKEFDVASSTVSLD